MVVLAYDHRAYDLMQLIKAYLKGKNIEFVEFASPEYDKLDSYAEFARQANDYILNNPESKGIYSCRSGIGIAIAANRRKGIRAGIVHTEILAFLARNDDDINVMVLPSEVVDIKLAKKLIHIYLNTNFEGGRHIPRLQQLDE